MVRWLGGVLLCLLAASTNADVAVRRSTICVQAGASAQERFAAKELRDHLSKIVGAELPLIEYATSIPDNSILVGSGSLAQQLAPSAPWTKLGPEQTLIVSQGSRMVIAGGSQRGTLYAVYRLLQVKCGVRWWTPWASKIPKNSHLRFGDMNWTESPAFEFRDPYWYHSFNADWAARNFDNGVNVATDDAHGGKTIYQGFVHTYAGLVDPAKNFPTHPEWFSLINGKRTYVNAQLCTTNPELRKYLVQQVIAQLRANPKATIISVSQNDCFNPCQCPVCRAQSAAEGSDAALVLDLANYVADNIKDEFPNVAVDTLAYQWSRHPTKTMKPRPNVIVRLCSIECNFGHPLFDKANQGFADDVRGWNLLTNRLYVWDYCTNFAHYLQPQPDYFSVGESLQWLAVNGVKGVFEEGDYHSNGGDMAELKAWVIAQMLWDPKQKPEALIDEFLNGYYGPAAKPIKHYLKLIADASQPTHVSFALSSSAPFLNFDVMDEAAKDWAKAKRVTAKEPEYAARVKMSALSPEFIWLTRWSEFRTAATSKNLVWPYEESRADMAARWLATAKDSSGLPGYSSVNIIDEGGTTPEQFVKGFGKL